MLISVKRMSGERVALNTGHIIEAFQNGRGSLLKNTFGEWFECDQSLEQVIEMVNEGCRADLGGK